MVDTTSLMFKVLSVLFTGSVLMIREIFLNSLFMDMDMDTIDIYAI